MSLTTSPRTGGEPAPYMGVNAFISIDGQELHCLASHVEISPDVTTNDITTFCGTRTYPGNVTWHFRLTAYQSFDDGGTDSILCAVWDAFQVDQTEPEFVVRPYKDRVVGPNNPEYTGLLVPQPYDLINMDAGGPSTIDIDWTLDGVPDRNPPCGETATRAAPRPNAGTGTETTAARATGTAKKAAR